MATISISNIRNIQSLVFEIPSKPGVYVLAGINGTGKSTLLACLARIKYWGAFRDNFKASRKDSIDEYTGSIKYEIDGHEVTYSKRGQRWRPSSRIDRTFEQFPYNETMLCDSTGDRLFVQNEEINSNRITNADQWLIDGMNEIFYTNRFNELKQIRINGSARGHKAAHRSNIAYLIKKGPGQYYSEKNFSLGEILILNLLLKLNAIQNNSMLLIDEIELALYPKVQINLLKYLRKISSDKSLLTIISTHSASLIKNADHIILLKLDGTAVKVFDECSPAWALGEIAFQEDITPDVIIFVEDIMAKYYLKKLLELGLPLLSKNFDYQVVSVASFKDVVEFHKQVKDSVFSKKTKLISFLDKDVETESIPSYRNSIPVPEFMRVYDSISNEVKFLPSTPEVGLVEFVENNLQKINTDLQLEYNNHSIDLTQLLGNPNYPKKTTRTCCKRKIKCIISELCSKTSEHEEAITKYLFQLFVNHSYSSDIQKNSLKRLLGPIFN